MQDITPDGRHVLFTGGDEVYVRDTQAGVTRHLSTNTLPYVTSLPPFALHPVMSANGQKVAFVGNNDLLFLYDLQADTTTLVSTNVSFASWPAVSADGQRVAYERDRNVYVWNAANGSSILVSVNADGSVPRMAPSEAPVISPDGRKVGFLSAATDLVPGVESDTYQLYVRDLDTGTTELLSADANGAASQNDYGLGYMAFRPDGNAVAFDSENDAFMPGDLNRQNDVFLRDLNANVTELVSVRHPDRISRSGTGNAALKDRSISSDGRRILFMTSDSNLVAGDTNGVMDIFVRDLATGMTIPVSTDSNGVFHLDATPQTPVISANGRYVLYYLNLHGSTNWAPWQVWRKDLDSGESILVTNGMRYAGISYLPAISNDGRKVAYSDGVNIIVADLLSGTQEVASVTINGWPLPPYDPECYAAVLSPDARWLLFASRSAALAANAGEVPCLYARDLVARTNICLNPYSPSPRGSGLRGIPTPSSFSGDSRYVVYGNTSWEIYRVDLEQKTTQLVATNGLNPSMSSDGTKLVYLALSSSSACVSILFKDLQTGTSRVVESRCGAVWPLNDYGYAQFSRDGRFVVFESDSNTLTSNDSNTYADIFVHDALYNTTRVLSRNLQGTGGANHQSINPVMSADGRTVAFASLASDLVPDDYNGLIDVFVAHLGADDSDNDGLTDAWEIAQFGNLQHDGSEDLDGDGHSNVLEMQAGTNPQNAASAFRVLSVTAASRGTNTLVWSAIPGKRYQVQYKYSLNEASWAPLLTSSPPWVPSEVVASGDIVTFNDPVGLLADRRFYRVVVLP